MPKEFYAIRLEPQMKAELEVISKLLNVSVSAWIRNVLAYEVRSTLDSLEDQMILEYDKGTIDKEDIELVFGRKIAQTLDVRLERRAQRLGRTPDVTESSMKGRDGDGVGPGLFGRIKTLLSAFQNSPDDS